MAERDLTGYPSIDKPWLKYYSEEAINAPLPQCTIYEYLWNGNKDYLNNVALTYFNNKITYGKLFENIENTAKALKKFGVKKGDIITVSAPTLPESVYLLYAISKIGAVANMVDPRTSSEGIKTYVDEVKSKLLFIVDVAFPKVKDFIAQTPTEKIITISPADSLKGVLKIGYKTKEYIGNSGNKIKYDNNVLAWNTFIKGGLSHTYNEVPYEKDRPVVIVHTGGTTGFPKGVMLSNDNINAATFQGIVTGVDMKREHNWLNIMPPFIAYGVGNGLHVPLVVGMETILIPQFDPNKFDELLIKYSPNHMVGVPSHYGNIINSKKMKDRDLSYIIAPTVGGDTMDINLENETNAFLKSHNCDYKVCKGYGMTEVCAAVSYCISNECNRAGSVGIPFSHTVISIFDPDTGAELKYGEQGEVCITGPNTMLGYYENEEATQMILKKHDDGKVWVHSGDIGYMTEDGFLYILDRVKRMIIRHDGFKVFPSMIENVVVKSEFVSECCVVGMADNKHSQGKLPVLYAVLKTDYINSKAQAKESLIKMCASELPEYAQPVEYRFIDKMPLTGIGKVDYRKLEEENK